ncbi:MAG TPA: hypothetical protein VNC22_23380 [Sporichthya sp.]|jgi:hypothetical protein|nr:hypothetical protein [Sporichthya sp.]
MRTQKITIGLSDDFPSLRFRKGDNIQGILVVDAEEPVVTPERYRYDVTIVIDKHPASSGVHDAVSLRSILVDALAKEHVFEGWRERNLVVQVDPPFKVD